VPVYNEPSAEQCGRFPEADIQQTYIGYGKGKETTSKSRTAAAGERYGALNKNEIVLSHHIIL
jgi:hypothetical protein